MGKVRRHKDLFTPEAAAKYLFLDELHRGQCGDENDVTEKALRTLRTLVEKKLLQPTKFGGCNMYHREHLNSSTLKGK